MHMPQATQALALAVVVLSAAVTVPALLRPCPRRRTPASRRRAAYFIAGLAGVAVWVILQAVSAGSG